MARRFSVRASGAGAQRAFTVVDSLHGQYRTPRVRLTTDDKPEARAVAAQLNAAHDAAVEEQLAGALAEADRRGQLSPEARQREDDEVLLGRYARARQATARSLATVLRQDTGRIRRWLEDLDLVALRLEEGHEAAGDRAFEHYTQVLRDMLANAALGTLQRYQRDLDFLGDEILRAKRRLGHVLTQREEWRAQHIDRWLDGAN